LYPGVSFLKILRTKHRKHQYGGLQQPSLRLKEATVCAWNLRYRTCSIRTETTKHLDEKNHPNENTIVSKC